MATAVTSRPHAIATRSRLSFGAVVEGWHLLSLDAPTVAAVWTSFLSRLFGVVLPWTAPAALFVAVWMLYVLDRLADARRGGEGLAQRHRFHERHAVAFAGALVGAVPLLGVLVVMLPAALREGWLLLAVPMAMYVAAVHWLRLRGVPKELLVSGFFAVAAAMPLLVERHFSFESAWIVGAFGGCCWLNCVAIARWERAVRVDALTGWAARHFRAAAAAVVVLGLAGVRLHPAMAVVCVVVPLLLILLDEVRPGATLLRALADAALLTPVVALLVLRAR